MATIVTIIINNSIEVASSVKFGNAAIGGGGQIQVPDVHSFTMSHTKKSFSFRRVFLLFEVIFFQVKLKI